MTTESTLTRSAWVAAYAATLQRDYPWASDPVKLSVFMEGVRVTLERRNGRAPAATIRPPRMREAWKNIGGQGKITLQTIRDLPEN